MRPTIRGTIKNAFRFIGLDMQRPKKKSLKLNNKPPELWSHIEEFQIQMAEIEDQTLVSKDRCFILYQFAKYSSIKDGDIAEVGVYRGGTGKLIAKTCPNKTIHLFDTFSGMPKEDQAIDHVREGDFSDTSLKSVQNFLSDCNNVEFHPGLFPNTASTVNDRSFCFVHVDVDIYKSVKDCLEFFYDKLVPGGVIIFDDYGWRSCPGVKKAVDEFLIDKDEIPIITTRSQCMLLKGIS